jgi:Tfp pilus assembly protein PilO
MRNILSIIIIIGSLASFALIVQPQYQQIQELQGKGEELEQVLVNARRLQSIRDDLLSKRSQISDSDLARLEKMVPENVDNVKLILELQGIADQYNLEIQTANANREEGESDDDNNANFVDVNSRDYGIISLDFNLTGNYFDFMDFLADLERNLRITDIRSVSFSGSDSSEYSFQLRIDTYWLKDNI